MGSVPWPVSASRSRPGQEVRVYDGVPRWQDAVRAWLELTLASERHLGSVPRRGGSVVSPRARASGSVTSSIPVPPTDPQGRSAIAPINAAAVPIPCAVCDTVSGDRASLGLAGSVRVGGMRRVESGVPRAAHRLQPYRGDALARHT